MEPTGSIDNICRMEGDDIAGLSDIIDILNTLDNPSPAVNGTPTSPEEKSITRSPSTASSSSSPSLGQPPVQQQHQQSSHQSKSSPKPYIRIVEQPAGKALRFRYECEGRSAGSIPGINSTPEKKTFPAIEIMGYKGDVVVVVSCVTKDPPYRPHPHNLVGKLAHQDAFKNGVCKLKLSGEPLRAVFSNLGIQCVKKKEIKTALDVRENMKIDPFKTKFWHKDQPSSIDLNVVRLCFQAFLPNGVKLVQPVVSDPIFDKKAMSDLVICRLCSCAAKVGGGDEIILLCEKVSKDDIKVKFYELNNEGKVVWEDFAAFQQTDIHKQTAIAFKTPRYQNTDITEKAKVFLQLVRPSDGITSEPLPFEYYPDPDQIKRKRRKTGGNPMNILRMELEKQEKFSNTLFQNDFKDISANNANFWYGNFITMPDIKTEPALSPHDFGPHRSPYQQMTPSPQPLSPMNRNTTPSPGLMKTLSASSQSQMCNAFQFNSTREQKSPYGNSLMANNEICDENKFVPVDIYNQNNNNNNGNSLNPFIDHMSIAPTTSGGSITPLWSTNNNSNVQNAPLIFQSMNIIVPPTQQQQQHQQHQQQQAHHQLQEQQFQQLKTDIDMIANTTTTEFEEGPTLSGLLASLDNEQLVNINSDDLPLSNLSITT